jgi:methylmalonyl-CoA/ethylmalonyl-CoA epimerase
MSSPNLLGSTTATQIGIVVSDIEATSKAWAEILGIPAPPIMETDGYDKARTEFQGEKTEARAKLAFLSLGSLTLELIEPIGESSTWNRQLQQHGPSLHHIAFETKDMNASLQALQNAGIALEQKGEYTGGRYAYVDARQQLGTIIELLEND